MKPDEVNKDMAGKRCKCIFMGLMVTGTIEEICIGDLTADVKVRFDEPHVWGKETFNSDWSTGRFFDNTGSLRYLEIIDDGYQTIMVIFSENIREINRMFTRDYKNWGVVNLKEWIDNYESSRFTQIDGHRAIITSEHNMEHLKEWLAKNTPVAMIEYI
ncbi:hypothetical protein FACS1894169_07190 [Bacteroidia bacterium]|nr:hypothetical protein FACS1894169_07190 [Bacteroidia bacterium]